MSYFNVERAFAAWKGTLSAEALLVLIFLAHISKSPNRANGLIWYGDLAPVTALFQDNANATARHAIWELIAVGALHPVDGRRYRISLPSPPEV
jgi:hypothetical protein